MCRILLLIGSDSSEANSLLDALAKASECDPLLSKLRGEECPKHDDGWGYALIGFRDGRKLSRYYRSTSPIFEDGELEVLKGSLNNLDSFYLIAHSRKMSKGEVSIFNTHPFHYSHKGFDLWFAHNGAVDDVELAAEMGLSYSEDISDSYYLGSYIYERVDDIASAFSRAKRFVKEGSAMNTILLADKPLISVATAYYLAEEPKIDYYRLFMSDGENKAVFSSSIGEYIDLRYEELRNGFGIIFSMKNGEIYSKIFEI
jgi:glutamine amidotransferase